MNSISIALDDDPPNKSASDAAFAALVALETFLKGAGIAHETMKRQRGEEKVIDMICFSR